MLFFAIFYMLFLVKMFRMHNYEAKKHIWKYSIIVMIFILALAYENWLEWTFAHYMSKGFKDGSVKTCGNVVEVNVQCN